MLLLWIAAIVYVTAIAAVSARGASPIRMTERGSSALVFLERHPQAGTKASRNRLARYSKKRIWNGLRLAGVYNGFMCIHRHESTDWGIVNPPYASGMQMDYGFRHTYGADYIRVWGDGESGRFGWPPWAQLVASYRAYHGYHGFAARGFTPWSTASACGL